MWTVENESVVPIANSITNFLIRFRYQWFLVTKRMSNATVIQVTRLAVTPTYRRSWQHFW